MLSRRILGTDMGSLVLEHIGSLTGEEPVALHAEHVRNDDSALLTVLPLSTRTITPAIVRAKATEAFDRRDLLVASSVSTVRDEGDKTYMQSVPEFGVKHITRSNELEEQSGSFVLKELQGSCARGVHVCLSSKDRKEFGSRRTITRSKAMKIVDQASVGITIEPLKRPIPVAGHGNMILRIFGLVSRDAVQVIGGVFCIEKEIVVSGSNVITGAIILE